MTLQQFFSRVYSFKTKKEISWRPFVGSSALKDKYSKSFNVCNQCKMNAFTKFSNISTCEKAETLV